MAQKHLQRMFEYFSGQVEMLPPRFRNRIEQVGLERSVGDYLAGMTDRYLENCYREQFPNG
jgi:dGTPase